MFPINYDPRELPTFQAAVRSLRALSPDGVTRLSIAGAGLWTIPPPIKSEVSSSIRELLAAVENLEILTLSSGTLPAPCPALTPQFIPPLSSAPASIQ
jgi:hypothetical protein